ncbi:MAG TPA: biotin/lipoyl-containing protein, partial [Gaiellaceae bacterium]|nr:biotin/lipoyl-containing protein [Gaiellaceae bacterium]
MSRTGERRAAPARLVEVTMPRLSDSMEEATILRWLKKPGDTVEQGEPLVEVETDKATVVYEAEQAGVLEEIAVGEGGTAALGQVIALLAVADGARVRRPRARATPVARRVAAELGVALEQVAGTGPGGRIVERDVRRAAQDAAAPVRPGPAPAAGGRGEATAVRLTPTQRTIAERMAASRAEIPEFTLEAEIDMEAASALRDDL